MQLVAIDYDETISACPTAWREVIEVMKRLGFRVIVVTYRQPDCDPYELHWLEAYVEAVLFTGQTNKRGFCTDQGYDVDVWIDDEPMSVTHNYHDFVFRLPSDA